MTSDARQTETGSDVGAGDRGLTGSTGNAQRDQLPGWRAAAATIGASAALGLWSSAVETAVDGPPRSWLSPVYLMVTFGLIGVAWALSNWWNEQRAVNPQTPGERRVEGWMIIWVLFWVTTAAAIVPSDHVLLVFAVVVPVGIGGRLIRRQLTARWIDRPASEVDPSKGIR